MSILFFVESMIIILSEMMPRAKIGELAVVSESITGDHYPIARLLLF